MRFNFAKASLSRDEINTRLADVQDDAMRLLSDGGVSRFAAQTEWRDAAAALVREAVQDISALTDPTPIFTTRRDGKLGDSYEFERLINTLRVVEYSFGSQPTIFTPRKAVYTINSSMHELAFGIDLVKILTGQHTIAEFANMAAEAMNRFNVEMVLTAVNAAVAVGVNDMKGRAIRTMAAGADVTKPELDAALRRMYAFNSGVTIFGSRYALDAIFTHGAAAGGDASKEDLQAHGVIGHYRGARLVVLPDDFNLYYQGWRDIGGVPLEKLLFITSGDPGAVMLVKDISALDWETLDPRKALWETGNRLEQGMLVHSAWKYHIIQLA